MQEEKYQPVQIYKHTDSMPYLLNWEFDVIGAFVAAYFLCTSISDTIGMQIGGFLIGITASKVMMHIRDNCIRGYLRHILFRIGAVKTKMLIPSHERYFVGA